MEAMNENPLRSRSAVVVSSREQELQIKNLQKLLAEERVRSEQRKTNYSSLKEEHLKLQKDFLTLQSEMKQILAETKLIKDKKDEDINQVLKMCEEKDKTIETLQNELKERDPQLIRSRLEDDLKEPIRKLEKNIEIVRRDKERFEYELKIAKQRNEFLEKENFESIERMKLTFEAEINVIKREKEEMRNKLMEINQIPDVKRFTELSEENSKLTAKVRAFQSTLEDAEQQYRKIQLRVESLVIEHENTEKEYEKRINSLNSQLNNLRQLNADLKQTIANNGRDYEELTKDMQRLKNEISRLKSELEERDKYFAKERERIEDIHMKNFKELEDERNAVSMELKKTKIELEAKIEAIARFEQDNISKDKEFQLKITALKQQEFDKRCALEVERNSMQTKLKDLKEEKVRLKEEIQQLRRQIENLSELRLSVERDSMMMRAKVESYQINMDELDKLRREQNNLHDNLIKLKSENTEFAALNKELVRQREQYKSDYERIKETLEEERKHMDEFKHMSDKNVVKLRNCIEEEKFDLRDRLLNLERDVIKCRKEKEDIKEKYKQYVMIAEKLQKKLKEIKERHKLDNHDHESSHHKSSQVMATAEDNLSPESYTYMRKELKLLKRRQKEISNLLNCSFDSTHCKERLDNNES